MPRRRRQQQGSSAFSAPPRSRDGLRERRLLDLLRTRRHAVFALGLTPLVFLIAGVIFAAATALTYAEGTVRYPEEEFEHRVLLGDATELYVLERAGIGRPPDIVVAVTGDDEDNMIICQVARERYGVEKAIARVNDPRNQDHFDLLGISPTVSATSNILAMIEHEVPEHELVHLLELRKENLEIVEVQINEASPGAGKRIDQLQLPDGARLISVMRDGRAEIAVGATELHAGDQVLAILEPGKEQELRRALLKL